MKKYKVAYSRINNAGDLFNEGLLDYFGVSYSRSSIIGADLVMLGGLLSSLVRSEDIKLRTRQRIFKLFSNTKKPLHVWGSGYLSDDVPDSYMRSNFEIHALRGKLSFDKLSKATQIDDKVVFADPGLLAREFKSARINKKYSVGIIPHFREKEVREIMRLPEKYKNATLIDICKPYKEVINEIASCDCIISSSLHGLIFADSLGIPNIHIIASNKLKGNGFKFRDYYSSFGAEDTPFELTKNNIPSLETIFDNYQINEKDVNAKIEGLINTFPHNI